MRKAGVREFIFSSTCATYGNPVQDSMNETHPQAPINPYGRTKLMVERILADFARGVRPPLRRLSVTSTPRARTPTARSARTTIPRRTSSRSSSRSRAGGCRASPSSATTIRPPDGTCIRDYIHILDLAAAHRLALDYLDAGGESGAFNLGNGAGYSVLEVIRCAEAVTGKKIAYDVAPRRPGDPPKLVGDSSRAQKLLGWKQKFGDLKTIVETAWRWHQGHPDGYAKG